MSKPTMKVRWFNSRGPVEVMPAALCISAYDGSAKQAEDEERLFREARSAQERLWSNPNDLELRQAYGLALRAWADFVGHRGAKDFAYQLLSGLVPMVAEGSR